MTTCRLTLRESLTYNHPHYGVEGWEPATYLAQIPNVKGWDICLVEEGAEHPEGDPDEQIGAVELIENAISIRFQLSIVIRDLLCPDDILVFFLQCEEKDFPAEWIDITTGEYLHDFYEQFRLIFKSYWRYGWLQGTLIVVPCSPENIEKVFEKMWGNNDIIGAAAMSEEQLEGLCDLVTAEFINAKSWQTQIHPLISTSHFYFEEIHGSRILRFLSTDHSIGNALEKLMPQSTAP